MTTVFAQQEHPTSATTSSSVRRPTLLDRATAAWATNMAALTLTGLFAGFFGTYSFSVVRGLAIADDSTYVAAFQGINETIRNAEFALVFFGALPAIIVALIANRGRSGQHLRLAALVMVFATMAITFVGNVPLNNDFAEANAFDAQAATAARAAFENSWNQLNLARTATSALAFIALAVAHRD